MIMNDISNTTTLDTPYPFIPMYPQWTATGELLRQRTPAPVLIPKRAVSDSTHY